MRPPLSRTPKTLYLVVFAPTPFILDPHTTATTPFTLPTHCRIAPWGLHWLGYLPLGSSPAGTSPILQKIRNHDPQTHTKRLPT